WTVSLVEPYTVIKSVTGGVHTMDIARQKDSPRYLGVRIDGGAWSDIGGHFIGNSFNPSRLTGFIENGRQLVAAIGEDGILRAKWRTGSWDPDWHQVAGGIRLDPQNLTVLKRSDEGLNLYADRADGARLRIRQNNSGPLATSTSWTVELVEASKPTTPLYRYYHAAAGDHYYTTTRDDYRAAILGYSYEGCEAQVYKNNEPGTVRLRSWYNAEKTDHFISVDADDGAVWFGYVEDPVSAGYVYHFSSPASGTVPLYRYWSGSRGDHYYTIWRDDSGLANIGYVFERIEAYVVPPPAGGCS
ncbi:MAG: hypothetical protein K1X38_14810, partial [Microthrixaceae bacterium]|nr:hypothetical protein [Microthrixaceae bacterium]